jgi:hypothetical protein
MKRKQKKRLFKKQNGLSNKDYCHHCLSHYCNPMYYINSIANRKRINRRRLKLCEACGEKICLCKNKGR